MSPATETSLQLITAQIEEWRREERAGTWLMVERLGAILLTDDHSTGWVDVKTLVKLAKEHNLRWGDRFLENRRMESLLRNTLKAHQIVQIDNIIVEFAEIHKGRNTIPALKFTKVLGDAAKQQADISVAGTETNAALKPT